MTQQPSTRRNRPAQDLLSVRAQTGAGSRAWLSRAGHGVRAALRDIDTANRLMGDLRVRRDHANPF